MSAAEGAGPGRRPSPVAAPGPLIDGRCLVEALTGLVAADEPADVAAAALRPLVVRPGVRAGLVARAPAPGADPVVLASSGYDCSTMGRGAVLPLDAGMPVTEAVRTGTTRVVGTGPSWVAVPAGTGAALLLSLTSGPPPPSGVALLERLGRSLATGLSRARRGEDLRADLLLLEQDLADRPGGGPGLVVHRRPYRAPLSGDVVDLVAEDGARWLLVADVCGRGHAAAVAADRLRAAFRACAAVPDDAGLPSAVLRRLDRALDGGPEDFATALVVRVHDGDVAVGAAGHAPPLLLPGGRVGLEPAQPLGLRLDGPWVAAPDVLLRLPLGSRLLASTDGLVDRRTEVDLDAVVGGLCPDLDAQGVLDAVVEACDGAGPAEDDVSVAVLTV